ncbi:MAG: rhomboid family intramembrane serine protease [Acidobacteriota bacterium]
MDQFFTLFSYLTLAIQWFFNPWPLGNEGLKSRRIPYISIAVVLLNAVIFVSTLQSVNQQEQKIAVTIERLVYFIRSNPEVLTIGEAQETLKEAGLANDKGVIVEADGSRSPLPSPDDEKLKRRIGEEKFIRLLNGFRQTASAFEKARGDHLYFRMGLGAGDSWKPYQLITYMFLHGGLLHLASNCVFFLALAPSIERLWGHGVFAALYVLVGMAACLPIFMSHSRAVTIGASGAISGIMGAFLVCFNKAKIKVGWLALPVIPLLANIPGAWLLLLLIPIVMVFSRKPFGIIRIPAYIFLTHYFISQLSFWWVSKMSEISAGVSFEGHVGGFFFGVFSGVMLELVRLKKDFAPPPEEPVVPVAIERSYNLLQQGDVERAAFKLRFHLSKNPQDTAALNTLTHIYKIESNHEQLTALYARIIRHNLSKGDRDSALRNFIQLQTALVGTDYHPVLAVRDWMSICDQMYRLKMVRETIYECRRLAEVYADDPLAVRALVMAGEAALWNSDTETARDSFEKALRLNPSVALETRIRQGLEKCNAEAIRQSGFSNEPSGREMELTIK